MMVLMVREREFHNTKLNNKTQLQHLLGEKRDPTSSNIYWCLSQKEAGVD